MAEVPQANSSTHPSVLNLFATSCVFCHLQYCFVISEVTGAQRGPDCSVSAWGGVSCLRPQAGLGVLARLTSTVPSPRSAATGCRAPRSAKARLFVRAVCRCCIELCLQSLLGFLPVTHCDQRNIFFLLCRITWLLFSCCCFFPPAFVAVGCDQGQVTGQDVPLLRRYGHANKLHSFQELFRVLEGDDLYRHTVSTAPGTALTCTTSSPPDPLSWGMLRAGTPPKMSVSEVADGLVCAAEWLWARCVCTDSSVWMLSNIHSLWWLTAAGVAVTCHGLGVR